MSLSRERVPVQRYTRNYVVFNEISAEALPPVAKRRATKEFMQFIESMAQQIRQRAEIGPEEVADPYKVAARFHVTVMRPDEIAELTAEDLAGIAQVDARTWSGTGLPLGNGEMRVVLNSRQTPERARVTLWEEITHFHCGHKPSQMLEMSNGLLKRTFDPRIEQEAFWTAAAILLPAIVLAKAVWRHRSDQQISAVYGGSVELVQFRLKTLYLWSRYQAYAH